MFSVYEGEIGKKRERERKRKGDCFYPTKRIPAGAEISKIIRHIWIFGKSSYLVFFC